MKHTIFDRENTGIEITGKKRDIAIRKVYSMLDMTARGIGVNVLTGIDEDGESLSFENTEMNWEALERIEYGYLVYIGSPESLENELSVDEPDIEYIKTKAIITVLMIQPCGNSVVTLNLVSGKLKILVGDLESFSSSQSYYTMAW